LRSSTPCSRGSPLPFLRDTSTLSPLTRMEENPRRRQRPQATQKRMAELTELRRCPCGHYGSARGAQAGRRQLLLQCCRLDDDAMGAILAALAGAVIVEQSPAWTETYARMGDRPGVAMR